MADHVDRRLERPHHWRLKQLRNVHPALVVDLDMRNRRPMPQNPGELLGETEVRILFGLPTFASNMPALLASLVLATAAKVLTSVRSRGSACTAHVPM